MTQAIDFIGDIHGHADALIRLLEKLGYSNYHGVWSHPHRQVCFLGDYIDRGSQQTSVIDIVRNMVETDNAYAIMGNHELNAIAWATPIETSSADNNHWLRPHNDKNHHQHRAFLEQITENSPQHQQAIDWFATLPLWLDFGDIRAIHACWHQDSIYNIKPHLDAQQRLLDGALTTIYTDTNQETFVALETLLKGQEATLPNDLSFADKDGHIRREIRLQWWLSDPKQHTYRQAAIVPEATRQQLPATSIAGLGYPDDIPVLFGHYWMKGIPEILTTTAACLDWSIAAKHNDRKLCAYRWEGEKQLTNEQLVWIED